MNLETIASELKSAQDRRQPLEPVTSRLPEFNMDAAYDVAGRIHAARLREGAAAIGAGELVSTGSLTGAPLIQAGEVRSATLGGLALPGLALALDP